MSVFTRTNFTPPPPTPLRNARASNVAYFLFSQLNEIMLPLADFDLLHLFQLRIPVLFLTGDFFSIVPLAHVMLSIYSINVCSFWHLVLCTIINIKRRAVANYAWLANICHRVGLNPQPQITCDWRQRYLCKIECIQQQSTSTDWHHSISLLTARLQQRRDSEHWLQLVSLCGPVFLSISEIHLCPSAHSHISWNNISLFNSTDEHWHL